LTLKESSLDPSKQTLTLVFNRRVEAETVSSSELAKQLGKLLPFKTLPHHVILGQCRLSAPQSLPNNWVNYSPSKPCHPGAVQPWSLGIILKGCGIKTKDIIGDCNGLQLITSNRRLPGWVLESRMHGNVADFTTGQGGSWLQKDRVNLCKAGPQQVPTGTTPKAAQSKISRLHALLKLTPCPPRWINNIPKGYSKTLIQKSLRAHGIVGSVQITRQRNGMSKGCCHIMCKTTTDAAWLDSFQFFSLDGWTVCQINGVNRKEAQRDP